MPDSTCEEAITRPVNILHDNTPVTLDDFVHLARNYRSKPENRPTLTWLWLLLCAGKQQHSVRRASRIAVDPGGAEGAAESSESAPRLQRGRREVSPMGCKNQQSFLHVLHHHRVALRTPNLHGMDVIPVSVLYLFVNAWCKNVVLCL